MSDVPLQSYRVNRGAVVGALACTIVGGAAVASYAEHDRAHTLRGCLVAAQFWLSLSSGGISLSLLHNLTGGAWGRAIRPILTAAACALPVAVLVLVVVALNLSPIYSWADPSAAADPLIAAKTAYLNEQAFAIRQIAYLIVLSLLLVLLLRQIYYPAAVESSVARRRRRFSGQGLAVYGLAISFAAIDWGMSLEPRWFSSTYGVLWVVAHGVAGLAFAIVVLALVSRPRSPIEGNVDAHHDLGKLLLGFIMLWAYIAFSQFIIIWYADLPEEVVWYLRRSEGGWLGVAIAIAAFHFAVPFLVLLGRDVKRRLPILATVAAVIVAMHWLDTVWLIEPAFPDRLTFTPWCDLAATVALGGVWLALFAMLLPRFRTAAIERPIHE
jgi:hypothetical protein